ncbi:MAG: alpha-N-acetylglucosaminidase [bacterium]|nr:alpha-N-acetylglucosaminidase [bacterium]
MQKFRKKRLLVTALLCLLPVSFLAAGPHTPGKQLATDSAKALLKRLLPSHSRHFIFRYIPPQGDKDCFEIQSVNNKIEIGGNTGVSIASGLHWYLKNYCHAHISLNHHRLDLPLPLPPVKIKIRKITPFRYRNYFNYCSFGYTMAWWDWPRWERMIDWMALNGINMPLAITGQEAVWQSVYRKLGLEENQIRDFLVGPAYLPWGWMGNIDGLGGPLPQDWIDRHLLLQQKIVARQRELGMTPILQGFTGHVPAAIKKAFPQAKILQTTPWAGMPGTWFLDPRDPLFQRIGKLFIRTQTRFYGTDHLYNTDSFNEVNPPTNNPAFIRQMGEAIYNALKSSDPQAIWVFQGWFLHFQADFWKAPQAKALLDAVPNDHTIGLDLWGEVNPVWAKTNSFYGKPWIWNVLCTPNQQVNMSGDLKTMQSSLTAVLESPQSGKLEGIGMMMEGFGYNPVVQEFITSKTWQPEPIDIKQWVADYARRRYGSPNPKLQKAWQLLLEGPYSRAISNGYESLICHTPKLSRFTPTPSDPFGSGYNALNTFKACQLLLECSPRLKDLPTYRFDVTHVTREMLSNLARPFNYEVTRAYRNKDSHALAQKVQLFLQLIRDMDSLLGANENFLLGRWISQARRWGTNPHDENIYRWNARTIVTMWEPARKSQLRDYASKEWSGLLEGFYLPRWQLFFQRLSQSLKENKPLNKRQFFRDLKELELNWTQGRENYPDTPRGDTLSIAHRLFKKYSRYYLSLLPGKAKNNGQN